MEFAARVPQTLFVVLLILSLVIFYKISDNWTSSETSFNSIVNYQSSSDLLPSDLTGPDPIKRKSPVMTKERLQMPKVTTAPKLPPKFPPNIFKDKSVFGSGDFNTVKELIHTKNWTLALSDIPYKAYVVHGNGTLLERIQHYNEAIAKLREMLWEVRQHAVWKHPASDIRVVWGSSDGFLNELSTFTQIKTIVVPWLGASLHNTGSQLWSSLTDDANILVKQYYPWLATEPLCLWIETPAFTKARWDAVYNRSCLQEIEAASQPTSLETVYFHGKPINPNQYWPHNGALYPSYFYSDLPPQLLYLHIAEDAVITETGDIFSGNLKLVPYACSHDTNPQLPNGVDSVPIYKDVFIITQFWCASFFHKMLECLPRIAPYLAFLRSNDDVLVHVAENGGSTVELLRILGINRERLISGTTRAKVVYMPQGTPCGFPVALESQILSHHLRLSIANPLPRRNLILVKRSGLRRFSNHNGIEKNMRQIAEDFDLNFQLFPDNPTPPLSVAMAMFKGAKVIVAPHGAGLSNMLFADPGTVVIEGVCNPPHVNMCFQWAAHSLGHRYHAVPSRGGCEDVVEVFPETMDYTVRMHLTQLQH